MRLLISVLGIFALNVFAAPPPAYLDTQQPLPNRVHDLLSRLTLDEKISQLSWTSPAIARLGVPDYNWSNECLHGVASPGIATVFPQAIGLAASWDESMMSTVATAIGDEARGLYHHFDQQGNHGLHTGLTCWSPNINIFRDPRWGRGQETYGEDPFLTAHLGMRFVKGIQGDDPKYLKAIATPKHFAVHSGPEAERHQFDAVADAYDRADTFLPAFEATVREAGAESVMCSYNRINGVPACSNSWLLQDTLRTAWKFPGYVVSDCGAVSDIWNGHLVAPDLTTAAAMAFNAGTDLACGDEYTQITAAHRAGLVKETRIDEAVSRLLRARFRLGMFDPPAQVPYAQIPFSVVDSPEHDALSLRAARESIVLLKNDRGTLPLSKNLRRLAVIGPNASNVDSLMGNYNGTPSHTVTPLQGLQRKLGQGAEVRYLVGSGLSDGLAPVTGAEADILFHQDRGQLVPGVVGEYFANQNLTGAPALQRIDSTVAFDWGTNSADTTLPAEHFSARWTGVIVPRTTGNYLLGTASDDGSRLYIDDKLVIDQWGDHALQTQTVTRVLEAGKHYAFRMEFYNDAAQSAARLIVSPTDEQMKQEAVALAADSDAVVMVLGISPLLENEGLDRTSIELPKNQQALLEAVTAVGKPTVVVLLNGSAIAANWASDHVPAIVEAWYPGQRGGDAIADVLFGDYNPAGRLPVTFYRSDAQLPDFHDYSMKNRTYRYFTGKPLFPFGFGLSYTKFAYHNLGVSRARITTRDTLPVTVDVKNSGDRAGEEVVELYVSRVAKTRAPIRALRGFKRVTLQPGETRRVAFTLTPADFSLVDEARGTREFPTGQARITVGGKQPGFTGIADAATTETLSASVEIVATEGR